MIEGDPGRGKDGRKGKSWGDVHRERSVLQGQGQGQQLEAQGTREEARVGDEASGDSMNVRPVSAVATEDDGDDLVSVGGLRRTRTGDSGVSSIR